MTQRLAFSMRDSMPHFVSSLRAFDEYKRLHAKRSTTIAQAEVDANAKYSKSPFARSQHLDDLVRFLDDTVLDINFMVQLPSIEKCLEQWWELYAKAKRVVDQDVLRAVYYDLAFVLVDAKTETIHKNAIAMIMRAAWTKWNPKESPLSRPEFSRLLFVLAHLMTTTNHLNDYVVFFQETLAKVRRHDQSKHSRSHYAVGATAATMQRKPKTRRKSSMDAILRGTAAPRTFALPTNQLERLGSIDATASSGGQRASMCGLTLNVKMDRVPTTDGTSYSNVDDDDETPDRFVEILARSSSSSLSSPLRSTAQHVIVDPLLHELRFQAKWTRPSSADATASLQTLTNERNPLSVTTFYPPMFISRVRTTTTSVSLPTTPTATTTLRQSQSGLALPMKSDTHDSDILRRSLSRVTLKQRIDATRARSESHNSAASVAPTTASNASQQQRRQQSNTAPLYLAIST